MTRSFARRTLLLLPLACAALYGCPSPESTTPEDEFADVIYEGETTDEALIALGSALDQAAPIDDAAHNPVLDAPAAGELPKSPIATFTWHTGSGATLTPAPGTRRNRLASIDFAPGNDLFQSHAEASRKASWPAALSQLLGPPRAASAHGDPVNGPAFFLVFASKSDPKLVRVFTALTTYTPSQEAWDKLVAAGSELTLSITGAEFDNNRLADGGGPFQGPTTKFTIAP